MFKNVPRDAGPVPCSITSGLNRCNRVKPVFRRCAARYPRRGQHYPGNRRLLVSKVFVLDSYYQPLDPVHPGWARLLLKQGKASVYRRFPCRRQMCSMGKHGFPRTGPKGAKRVRGFQTGDMVRAVVRSGTRMGTYVGRVAVRAAGLFNITTKHATVTSIPSRYCTTLHKCDGYTYRQGARAPSSRNGTPVLSSGVSTGEATGGI
jgi:RRXRR protein